MDRSNITLPRGLKFFEMRSRHKVSKNVTEIASDKASAWNKFVTLHFGALKPARKDWRVCEVK